MTKLNTSSAEFFEAKYQSAPNADPWQFATADYELRRYDALIRSLAGRRYKHAFEPGCSIGMLTERLAPLCGEVFACDFSPTASASARARCEHLPGVKVRCAALTAHEPWADFDLIVLSEIGYYFTPTAWSELVQSMVIRMQPGTVLLASHWLGSSIDHVQSGDEVHNALAHALLQLTMSERHEGFRLERWTRTT